MPVMQGLLRRRGQASDADIRRHSFFFGEPSSAQRTDGRTSEQNLRKPDASDLSPSRSNTPVVREEGSANVLDADDTPIQPPPMNDSGQTRRFSTLLRFRNASDSQLATRARMEAQQAAAPPMPRRTYCLPSY